MCYFKHQLAFWMMLGSQIAVLWKVSVWVSMALRCLTRHRVAANHNCAIQMLAMPRMINSSRASPEMVMLRHARVIVMGSCPPGETQRIS